MKVIINIIHIAFKKTMKNIEGLLVPKILGFVFD